MWDCFVTYFYKHLCKKTKKQIGSIDDHEKHSSSWENRNVQLRWQEKCKELTQSGCKAKISSITLWYRSLCAHPEASISPRKSPRPHLERSHFPSLMMRKTVSLKKWSALSFPYTEYELPIPLCPSLFMSQENMKLVHSCPILPSLIGHPVTHI